MSGDASAGRFAIDGDDQIAGADAAGIGRTARNDVDDGQTRLFGLELDAKPDKIAFDLREQLVHLTAGQKARVFVEGGRRAADELQDDGLRRASRSDRAASVGDRLHELAGLPAVGNWPRSHELLDIALQCGELSTGVVAEVLGDKQRLGHGDLHACLAAGHQALPLRLMRHSATGP